MEADRALSLLECLDRCGIDVWLDGGWGVDALLGTQTRSHDDLDLIVRLEDAPELERALGRLGYARMHGEPPQSFEVVDPEGHQVDVHPVRFTAAGEALYEMSPGEEWVYPDGSLAATGTILGREVRCQTPEMQLRAHTIGYALDADHRADVTALRERFGLPLPPFRSAEG